MKKLCWILFLFFLPFLAEATHQVSGYITVKWLYGTTYQATIVDFTNTCNTSADRDTLRLWWGDGTSEIVYRQNGNPSSSGIPNGVMMNTFGECDCRKINIYVSSPHTFPGPSTYRLWFDDQDRMANILNVNNPQSVNTDFYIFHTITLNPFIGYNFNSVLIKNYLTCIYACTGQCFNYNMGAYSPDGDSLSYSLGTCNTLGDIPAPGYYIPAGTTIDSETGTIKWCSPTTPGIYNFSIRAVSYKRVYISGKPYSFPVDTTEAELEFIVSGNCTIYDPVISGPTDTCVVAGTNLTLNYKATDIDGQGITLAATGDPFLLSPPATWTTIGTSPVFGTFNWQTNCSEVRSQAYPVLITATNPPLPLPPPSPSDPAPSDLSTYLNTNIYVIGPAPTNLGATLFGNTVQLSWTASVCTQVTGYNVYRHKGCSNWQPTPCETGVPSWTGYTYIGSTTGTTFTDNNGGKGLVPGIYYSYVVDAIYPLAVGAPASLASKDTCVLIKRDAPLITNVSVENTSASGTVFIRWAKPLIGNLGIDTITDPPPYKYVLKRAVGMNSTAFTDIDSVTGVNFNERLDTTFIDNGGSAGLNTQSNSYNYQIDLYSNGGFKGSSATASSIYLSARGSQNCSKLSWSSVVPWNDSLYNIYHYDGVGPFVKIATVPGTQHNYTDTNLHNGGNYCYYIESLSTYSDPSSIHSPLFDSSEIQCASPRDTIAPCAPQLKVSPLCNNYEDSLIWNDPNHFCKNTDDVVLYNIYYSATEGGDMQIIRTISNPLDTIFTNDSLNSIAGCYAVTAVDSAGNESTIIPFCVDNCPQYQLPNVITPNGDGDNDFFTPIKPYRYIKSIDINIFNRWGQVMFHTINPEINWNGTDQNSGDPCPDGVYYYVCTVNEIHVTGIVPITLKGFVQIIRK
ncbi:MAG TPA: gliding motility-associated C-terminal domain-containing protein [Bacteroidia bacterium]|nr:gliding motility-associated C-terminal domain-containing protein [Bacteroidia bacterium]